MGYSCTRKASDTEHKWQEACRKSTGSSNSWQDKTGSYFYEVVRENDDGAITGTVYRNLPDGYCRRSGSFRIEPDGSVTRAPAFFKSL